MSVSSSRSCNLSAEPTPRTGAKATVVTCADTSRVSPVYAPTPGNGPERKHMIDDSPFKACTDTKMFNFNVFSFQRHRPDRDQISQLQLQLQRPTTSPHFQLSSPFLRDVR